MPASNELILHSPRIGILHGPRFDQFDLIQGWMNQEHIIKGDAEYVMVSETLGLRHPLTAELDKAYRHYSFVGRNVKDDLPWATTWAEVIDYATHLVVFMTTDDIELMDFMRALPNDVPPAKVLII